MKIETKLTFNNMKKNIKRTLYTTISIALCAFLIITTILVATSISTGFQESIASKYNDYHFVIKNIDIDNFNKIKDKSYISQIYLQENDEGQLYEINNLPNSFQIDSGINVYIKYDNIRRTSDYTNDILKTLNYSIIDVQKNCELNTKLLNASGLIDVSIGLKKYTSDVPNCQVRLNFTYVLDIMFIIILLVFSILSIIILYNAFLITINERKKEYAVLNSVGATESQILKMTFLENIIIGMIGIIIGFLISVLGSTIILRMLNNILEPANYHFGLVLDIKYMMLSLVIMIINIYLASLIPSVKASSTSIMQGIKNNKQIKFKKNNSIFEKVLPIEGKIALKNSKRNKNKYRIITILLVICMTSYITITTYINYEKVAEDLMDEYDIDAEIDFSGDSNQYYKSILDNYVSLSGEKIEYFEYKKMGVFAVVEPEDALIANRRYADSMAFPIVIIGLDDKIYNDYIADLNANNGDYIIYNNITEEEGEGEFVYRYENVFKTNYKFNLKIICRRIEEYDKESYTEENEIIDDKNLRENFVLTEKLPRGFKEIKNTEDITIFTNMNTFNNIDEKMDIHSKEQSHIVVWYYNNESTTGEFLRIKCDNVIGLSDYIENLNKKQDNYIHAHYYSLDNQEKIIYTNVLQLILKTIISIIIIIGIISSINIINASLCEREEEFKTLSRLGATKGNINKILIYENIYIFIKATIISTILSIPIIYLIIKYMKNVIVLDKILIPYASIGLFILLLLVISMAIAIYSTKFIKEE